jgi:subtilase family serine protease
VPDDFATGRLLLQLNRPPDRQAALAEFLTDVHTVGSPSYHKWVTPRQFGEQFGPADSDIQLVSGWLGSHGLRVTRVTQGREFLEFSGTAAQLREAFHSQIHRYEVKGSAVYANADDIRIPEALSPLVRGISPLGTARTTPYVKIAGRGLYSRGNRRTKAEWTLPNPFGTANPYAYPVTPEDLATQYDLAPLYQAGVNGAGQTIGIINESNVDLSLIAAYQGLFGLAGTTPQVVIDGDDPGTLDEVDVEAYLDLEVAGAVTPKATVNLYIAGAGDLIDPLELAALRAIEDNQASVLSVSFGECELFLQNGGNQIWASLWEQAAAQGQTVLVATGDSGSECTLGDVNTVSGLASTPWNIAVGGTDFYYSDYATGGASAATLWNSTNDNGLGSLLAPLQEQPWDDAYGLNVIADGYQRGELGAGGGGASNCAFADSATGACINGYSKPVWQNGPGVPADGVRDLPDVSLFASNGANLSAYAICAYEGECATGSGNSAEIALVGGTSASTPAMAGIMALVDQKYGRQGQANVTLYPLAQQMPNAFHDVTVGNNSEICGGAANPPTCVLQWNGIYGSAQYSAGPGYDQASGLGSVDGNALVNNWNAITFKPTSTIIQLSKTAITHGTPISVSASVFSTGGSGMPTGVVAVETNSSLPSSQGQFSIVLANGSGTANNVNYLPGGQYEITGRYGGDGIFASSTSSPVSLTVKPEPSNINFSMTSGTSAVSSGASVPYNAPFQLNVQPGGVNAAAGKTLGIATGTATFTIDSISATVALNGAGVATWVPPALPIGIHTVSATYSGDASFQPSSAAAVTFGVAKGPVWINGNFYGPLTFAQNNPNYLMSPGNSIIFGVTVQPGWTLGINPSQIPLGTATPTGTVELCLTENPNVGAGACPTPSYTQTVTLTQANGVNALQAGAVGTFQNVAPGWYMAEAVYQGDGLYAPYGLIISNWIQVAPLPALIPTAMTLAVSPGSISGTDIMDVTATVSGSDANGMAPGGWVEFFDEGVFLYEMQLPNPTLGASSSVTFHPSASWFWNSGANTVTAVYPGDGATFGPSISDVVAVKANQTAGISDFTLAPQIPRMTVKAGSRGSFSINLASLSNFNGSVSLSCRPSSTQFSCSINPDAVTLNGMASATVTVNATQPATAMAPPYGFPRWSAAGMLALCMIWMGGRRRRALSRNALLALGLLAVLAISSCGGGSGSGSGVVNPPPPPNSTPAGNYSVLVTATANGTIHNALVNIVVQ